MGLYEGLKEVDVIGPVRDYMKEAGFILTTEGKIVPTVPIHFSVGTPWLNARVDPERECSKWLGIYFSRYGIVPRRCFGCLKIFCKPRTLKELFAVRELQLKMAEDGIACKCGIERRPWATPGGFYSAFWYTPLQKPGEPFEDVVERGIALRKLVEKEVHQNVSETLEVKRKRACTEMELEAGPTDTWVYPEEQNRFEDLLDATWDLPVLPEPECKAQEVGILVQWIEHAFAHNDPTVKEYCDSLESFGYRGLVTYGDDQNV